MYIYFFNHFIILQERSWEKLEKAVLAIQTSRPISTSLEELYQMVENLSSMGQAEKVFIRDSDPPYFIQWIWIFKIRIHFKKAIQFEM